MNISIIEQAEHTTMSFHSRVRGLHPRICVHLLKLMRIAGLKPELRNGDTRERLGLLLRRIQLGLEEKAAGREMTMQEQRADREIRSLIQQDEM